MHRNFLQEKAVEATKQKKRKSEPVAIGHNNNNYYYLLLAACWWFPLHFLVRQILITLMKP
jgi:hypothetical protein